jgi:methyltransferase-like protein
MKSLSGFAFRGKKLLRHEVLGEVGKLILDGVITPHTSRMGILETPPKKPKLRPYARFELQNQNWATNKRHEYSVFEGIERKIALLFDGTITEKEAIITVLGWFENGTLTIPEEISEDGNADGPDKIAVSLVAEVLDKLTMCAFL